MARGIFWLFWLNDVCCAHLQDQKVSVGMASHQYQLQYLVMGSGSVITFAQVHEILWESQILLTPNFAPRTSTRLHNFGLMTHKFRLVYTGQSDFAYIIYTYIIIYYIYNTHIYIYWHSPDVWFEQRISLWRSDHTAVTHPPQPGYKVPPVSLPRSMYSISNKGLGIYKQSAELLCPAAHQSLQTNLWTI